MLDLKKIVDSSDGRFKEEIDRAKGSKGSDKARIERRKNEVYFKRLVKATLGASQAGADITNKEMALAVAFPEVLFLKMFELGSESQQPNHDSVQPQLLRNYHASFNTNYRLVDYTTLKANISNNSWLLPR